NAYVNQGAQAIQVGDGTIIKPRSGIRPAIEDGKRNYTNYYIFVPAETATPHAVNAANAPPFSGYFYETPSSLACVYKLVAQANGCNPNTFHTNTNTGSKAIGIVDAYDAPNVRADLTHYATQFGLPAITTSNFVIYYCTGSTASTCATGNTHPAYDSGWEGETSLDVQMAHALAPKARIYLVLAKDNSNAALYAAVDKAAALVAGAGGGEVSMSWGHNEVSNDASTSDSHFGVNKVVYFASTGDKRAVGYPATSTKVVSVGGTSISRNATTGAFIQEVSWADAGAGPSAYIARPSYQPSSIGSKRGNPDVSAVANGATGVWVYISGQGGWYVFGGTSVASPVMAAIVNSSGHFSTSTAAQQSLMYGTLGTAADWFDVKLGYCGVYASLLPKAGYDFCTGIGSPRGTAGK
ncbi:MAG TPA: hypothetical protein VG986_22395, partial [Pseudolabrys sp.]|nr:hypothetical protein [Pseudolabrys sp.]